MRRTVILYLLTTIFPFSLSTNIRLVSSCSTKLNNFLHYHHYYKKNQMDKFVKSSSSSSSTTTTSSSTTTIPSSKKRDRDEDNNDNNNENQSSSQQQIAKQMKSLPLPPAIRRGPLPYECPDINSRRGRLISKTSSLNSNGKCVIYWMSRDQRMDDNYSLLYAQSIAINKKVPLKIVFNLVPKFLDATLRQFGFMIRGLEEVERQLREKDIPMFLTMGDPITNISDFAIKHDAIALVVDFSPIRVPLMWVQGVADLLDNSNSKIPFVQIDAHNVVPCWTASEKLEYGARTIRGKIQKLLPEFLVKFPAIQNNPSNSLKDCKNIDWKSALDSLQIDRSVKEVTWLQPGPSGARQTLEAFVNERLKSYEEDRNNPNKNVCSNLSPYFHFGQISAQRTILYLKEMKKPADSFVEEAVVRRELADNFCFYNTRYDSLSSLYDWAKETLRLHSSDKRSVVYSQEILEKAKTHDDLWNAAQLQMVQEGKMHGFLRMYWAKKILEWTASPEEALRISLYLNDKYELDGRDPNGYVGCMWSIGGIHDQGWKERDVFGKIRYMNYAGCQRKFNVSQFVAKYPPAAANAKDAAKLNPKAIK